MIGPVVLCISNNWLILASCTMQTWFGNHPVDERYGDQSIIVKARDGSTSCVGCDSNIEL